MRVRDRTIIRDVIWFQYSKLVARRAYKLQDGHEAKKHCYGFIKNLLHELQAGTKSWEEVTRENWPAVVAEEKCLYCGSEDDLDRVPILPRPHLIDDRCPYCDKRQSARNLVWVCGSCVAQKGDLGFYEFFKLRMPDQVKFYDFIPALVEKKYLEAAYECLDCAKRLDEGDADGDDELTVLDIDHALKSDAPAPSE